jgi:hypothetical protein
VAGTAIEDVAHGSTAAAGTWRQQVEVTLREHERHGPPGGRPQKVPDTRADRSAALAEAAAEAGKHRRLAALLVTGGWVGLEHFARLETTAAVILLQAIESALAQLDQAAGCGQAYADGSSVLVEVRPGVKGRIARVELAEGRLTAPDLRIRVSLAQVIPTEGTRDQSWSVA